MKLVGAGANIQNPRDFQPIVDAIRTMDNNISQIRQNELQDYSDDLEATKAMQENKANIAAFVGIPQSNLEKAKEAKAKEGGKVESGEKDGTKEAKRAGGATQSARLGRATESREAGEAEGEFSGNVIGSKTPSTKSPDQSHQNQNHWIA